MGIMSRGGICLSVTPDYISLMLEANRQLEAEGLDISVQETEDAHLKPQHNTDSKLKVKAMSMEVCIYLYDNVKSKAYIHVTYANTPFVRIH